LTVLKKILDQRIGDIAARDSRKADVLIKYGIDFYCNGKQTLSQAIQSKGLISDQITEQLALYNDADILPSRNMAYWNIGFLCEFVVQTHHNYVKNTATMLKEYGEIAVKNHHKNHPELQGIHEMLKFVLDEMHVHMEKEETEIFPAMKKLWNMYVHPEKINLKDSSAKKILNGFVDLEKEHAAVWKQIETIKRMTHGYSAPNDACVTYQIYITKLKEFEDDLMNHVHIENNILFPKVLALASKF